MLAEPLLLIVNHFWFTSQQPAEQLVLNGSLAAVLLTLMGCVCVCVWSCGSKTCVVSNLSIECGILCSVQSCNGRALGNNNVRQMAYILSSIIYCRPKYDDTVGLAAKHTGSL